MVATVLVVEDNPILQLVLVKQLDKLGFPADCASHGGEAIELFKQNRHYKLILMDVMMPDIDGLQATSRIRFIEQVEDLVRVPIIGITAIDDRDACLAAGMDDYYKKPVTPGELKEILNEWISHGLSFVE